MNTTSASPAANQRMRVITAFAVVYIAWGSTYLAIRVCVAVLPPFLMAGIRYLIAGSLLYAWLWWRGEGRLTARQWREAAITGALLLAGGNGLVCWAEQTVNSSLAALILTSAPIWFAVFDTIRPGGRRPQFNTVAGIIVGSGGVVLLVFGQPVHNGGATSLAGACALVAACGFWAGGSLYNKYYTQPASPWMSTAAQMLCGSVANLLVGTVAGEWPTLHLSQVTATAGVAFAYLIIFGSILGFSAYVWLLTHCAPAKVATYAYVNPVIATLLGWLVLGEPLTPTICLAGGIILTGVLIVQWPQRPKPAT
ncbi:MAG TPA: EamA family transporter [Opitutales bacterium]|nr:EamA family transporter [Opitutales bacterium]